VSSLCSAWSGDSNNQTLNASGNVTVTVSDGTGATNDGLTVSSASCTFNFGSINLGANNYVTGGNLSFGGSGGNISTIAWDATNHVLTITLGHASGGTANTVASSTPVYTASPAITDTSGNPIANSPFTLPTGRQF